MLKCGHCGAGMTLVTGKAEIPLLQCQRRMGQKNDACDSQRPDGQARCPGARRAGEKAFTPKRVKGMLQKLKEGLKSANTEGQAELAALTKELKDTELATEAAL